MAATRFLIVNADDFGLSPGVNRGIIRAHEQGLVTSASLMVRWPAAPEAAAYARRRPALSVGLHCDLGEWAYRDGAWVAVYAVVTLNDAGAVKEEVGRQLAAFRRLVGRDPTHLDSHQHVHRRDPVRGVLVEMAGNLGIPLRHEYPGIRYCGDFYGQGADGTPYPEILTVEYLTRILAGLPPGTTEFACHPGEAEELDTMYRQERAREVEVLCDPRTRAALAALGFELRSFAAAEAAR
jgi:predicted glycoside hydrolase/deacetylase ChbG (UPF0249 family)